MFDRNVKRGPMIAVKVVKIVYSAAYNSDKSRKFKPL
jgi:hypothetical protein